MKIITGTYLVCGGDDAPQLHLLSADECRTLLERDDLIRTDAGRVQAMRLAFRMHARYALPAWRVQCMEAIATQYTGPHETAVRGMAAALALGLDPHGKRGTEGPSDGGTPVKPAPRKPKPAAPAGGFFDTLSAGNSASA